jgi:hypothetical protein
MDLGKLLEHKVQSGAVCGFCLFRYSFLRELTWKPQHVRRLLPVCTLLFPDGNGLSGTIPTEIGLMTALYGWLIFCKF